MAVSWTLEKELRGLVDASTTGEALCRLGLASDPDDPPRLEEIHPWRRGGAETYLYRFKVIGAAQEHDVLLKAVTAFSTTRTLRELVDEWVCRRHLLASGGVRTPKFYFSGRGLLVEQYVEEKLAHRLRCRPANSVELTDQVFALAGIWTGWVFHPSLPSTVFELMGRVSISSTSARIWVRPASGGGGKKGFCPRPSIGSPVSAIRSSIPRGPEAVYAFHLDGEARNEQRPA